MKSPLLTVAATALAISLLSCEKDDAENLTSPLPEQSIPEAVEDNRSEEKKAIDQIIEVRSRQQAEGLGEGRVEVNGAWHYTGYSYLSPDPNAGIEARLVAVDITIAGHTPFFDMDDIEIVDGVSGLSYGSDPHATILDAGGRLPDAEMLPPVAPATSRWLLIYAFPKGRDTFDLVYWGQKLTRSPQTVADGGWELPYPPSE